MEEMKTTKKHFSKLGGMFLVGTVIIYAAQLGVIALVKNFKAEWLSDPDMSIMLSVLPMYLIGMPALIALVKRIPAQVPEKRKMKVGSFLVAAIMCFGLVYFSNIFGTILTTIISMIKGEMVGNVVQQMTTGTSLWVIIFYMVICAPIMEEYIFRKLIVDRTMRYGQGVAVVVSGLMFGLFHGNLNQFAYAFTLGMFFAFLYVKTGNIKITIGLHMMINFVGGALSSILMNALDMEEYTLVMSSGDMNRMMEYIMENIGPMLGLMAFGFFVIAMLIAGLILFIVAFVKKKFAVAPGEVVIPKGQRFTTVILNVGMILNSIFWIGMIIWQLCA